MAGPNGTTQQSNMVYTPAPTGSSVGRPAASSVHFGNNGSFGGSSVTNPLNSGLPSTPSTSFDNGVSYNNGGGNARGMHLLAGVAARE